MTSLRQEAKQRLKVAFDEVRAVSGSLTFILVVDEKALKVLSNTIKMMDLINYGITSVERLELKRKKFQKIEVVYLIHPDSYQLLLDDYSVEGDPQYHTIHILTLTKISITIMTHIAGQNELAKRIKSLKQINMNYIINSQNQFLIMQNDSDSFVKTIQPEEETYNQTITSTIDQLASVLTSFSSFYIVQILYSKTQSSNLGQKIALGLKERLQGMFKTYDKQQCQNYNSSCPPTTFIILDRSYDPLSPLMRDFHYMSLLYEEKNVKNHKIQGLGKDKKIYNLDQNDQIFQKYRNSHFAELLTGINSDFQNFSQNHIAAKFEKNGGQENNNLEKMSDLMKKIPQYTESKDKYALHMQLANDIFQTYEKGKYRKIGQLQQEIATQTTEKGKKIKSGDIFNQIMSLIPEINEYDKARLISIALISLDLKPKQKTAFIQQLNKMPEYTNLSRKISSLIGVSTHTLNLKKDNKTTEKLILDRHLTKVEELLKDVTNGGQGDLKFVRVGTDSKSQKHNNKNTNALGRKKIGYETQSKNSKPRIILFMASAMGYNEMRALSEFETTYHLIFGSHNFVTPKEYLAQIKRLSVPE